MELNYENNIKTIDFLNKRNIDKKLSELKTNLNKTNTFLQMYNKTGEQFHIINNKNLNTIEADKKINQNITIKKHRRVESVKLTIEAKDTANLILNKIKLRAPFPKPTINQGSIDKINSNIKNTALESTRNITNFSNNLSNNVSNNASRLPKANRFLRKNTQILSDQIIFNMEPKPETTTQKVDNKYVNFVYSQIFDKNFQLLVKPRHVRTKSADDLIEQRSQAELKRYNIKQKDEFIHDKITKIKTKCLFIKGIYDYACPKVLVKKMQIQNKILNQIKLEKEKKFIVPKNIISDTLTARTNTRMKLQSKTTENFYTPKLIKSSSQTLIRTINFPESNIN